MYTLIFAPQAIEDLSKLKKSEPAAFKKAGKLLAELQGNQLGLKSLIAPNKHTTIPACHQHLSSRPRHNKTL